MENIQLIKEVYGLNTYSTAVDTEFSELVSPATEVTSSAVTINEFFTYYDELFFQIPVSGSINSHTYLVERSQQYIGGSVIDAEKQALIEEINSLRQQLLDLNQSFKSINDIL
jgi:hypothetical protein